MTCFGVPTALAGKRMQGSPAERRDSAVDPKIGRRLINDNRLYAGVLRGEPLVAEVPVRGLA